ncbi:MAG: hypothetical protein LBJ13_03195, partial [Puniceicoccales bacterium]|nr:hypothetical protein [Puniceicoccales bacterium]
MLDLLIQNEQSGTTKIKYEDLLRKRVEFVTDLITIENLYHSLLGAHDAIVSKINDFHEMYLAQKILLDKENGFVTALEKLKEAMFASSPTFNYKNEITILEEPSALSRTTMQEQNSVNTLVMAYNNIVGFFKGSVFWSSDIDDANSGVRTTISDYLAAYEDYELKKANTGGLYSQNNIIEAQNVLNNKKNVLKAQLANSNVAATLEYAFAEIQKSETQQAIKLFYLEICFLAYEQLQTKISEQAVQLKTYLAIESGGIWRLNGSQISETQAKAHNDYITHLIESLYRFAAVSYLGIIDAEINIRNDSGLLIPADIVKLRSILSHWEELEVSEHLAEKYLPDTESLKTLLHKAYVQCNNLFGNEIPLSLPATITKLYGEGEQAGDVVLNFIRASLANDQFTTASKLSEDYLSSVTDCVSSLNNVFKAISNAKTLSLDVIQDIQTIDSVPLDKFLHDYDQNDTSVKLISNLKTLAAASTDSGSVNSKINALNAAWKAFYVADRGVDTTRPDTEGLQTLANNVNIAFGNVIAVINGLLSQWNSLGNIPVPEEESEGSPVPEEESEGIPVPEVSFSQMLNDFKAAFVNAQSQCYLAMLSRIYNFQDKPQRKELIDTYKEKILGLESEVEVPSEPASIAEGICNAIAALSVSSSKDETLLGHFASSSTTIESNTLVKNMTTLGNEVSGKAIAGFSAFNDVNESFQKLNMLLWNILNRRNNPTEILAAIGALGSINEIPGDLIEDIPDPIGKDAESAISTYGKLKTLYDAIRSALSNTGDGTIRDGLQRLDAEAESVDDYKQTKIYAALKSLLDSQNMTNASDTVKNIFRAFNMGCFMVFLQNKYPGWNDDDEQLQMVRTAYQQSTNTIDFKNYFTCGDDANTTNNISSLFAKIKNYQGDLKIVDPTIYYSNGGKFYKANEDAGWLYRLRSEKDDYMQFDVDQHVQYINNNGTYFELAENDVAFVQLSPEEHIRILMPNQFYQREGNKFVVPQNPESTSAKYVLGENGQYYAISNYPLKYKVYNGGNIKYVNVPQEKISYYKATKKGYAEVPAAELPNMNGRPANGKDYFIYGDEGQYYKADDVYTRYVYKPAETSDGDDGNAVPGTYYRVVNEDLNATGNGTMYVLENGDVVTGEDGPNTVLYYRSTQNGQKFFGIKLYQWGVDERYVSMDDENLVTPVEYERFVPANQITSLPNFTQEGKDVYVYSDITKEYRRVGSSDEFYFSLVEGDGEKQVYRIEFPDRRYVFSSSNEYLYVPHPETKYDKAGEEALRGDYIYTNGKFLKIPDNAPTAGMGKTNDAISGESSLNNFYVQANDGGFYPLSAVKIKTSGGTVSFNDANFTDDLEHPLAINNWQPYSLEETVFNNLFLKDDDSLIRASISNATTLKSFVTPVKNEIGTYVLGSDGVYYQFSDKLYADYDLGVDTGIGFIVNGEQGVLPLEISENKVNEYVLHGGSYNLVKKVGESNLETTSGNLLVKGNNYIQTTSLDIIKVDDSDRRYVKLFNIATTDNLDPDLIAASDGGVYVSIKDKNNKTVLKKKIASIALQDSGIIVCPNPSYSVSVKDKNFYKTETVCVEDATGKLHELKDVKVFTGASDLGYAYDPTGQSNIYANVGDGSFVKVPKPSEQYTVAESPTGDYICLENMYYDKGSDDITVKVCYQSEESTTEMYRALDQNDPNIPIYLEVAGTSKVAVAPISEDGTKLRSGLWFKNKIEKQSNPQYPSLGTLDEASKKTTAFKVGAKYYSMADWQLVVKKNGKLQ